MALLFHATLANSVIIVPYEQVGIKCLSGWQIEITYTGRSFAAAHPIRHCQLGFNLLAVGCPQAGSIKPNTSGLLL